MALSDALRRMAGRNGKVTVGHAATKRRAWHRRTRRAAAGLLGPVLAASMSVPAVVTAGTVAAVAAVAVVKAPPAKAASGLSVAVVLVNGETSAPETAVLQAAGYTVTQVTPATLSAMSQATFQGYAAVVIGDSSTSTSCSTTAPATSSLGSQWEGWVTGNVAVLGTAPARPGTSGANALIANTVGYAAQQPPSGAVTGLYLSLNCGYASAAAGTAVALLAGVDGIGIAGGVSVNGSLACTDAGTVNTWEADAAGTFTGYTSASVGTGSSAFPSPSCPVEETFDSWPAMFTPLAYDSGSDATKNFTASDGVTGQPYILLGVPVTSASAALAPSQNGEVQAGATLGGGNAAAVGLAQASVADPVDTETGDFSQSGTDMGVPSFGPGLDFSPTYDAVAAEQETEAGTPGPMGYGWTDNWATSLATAKPVPADIYTMDGLATDNGNGGAATRAAIGDPSDVYLNGANIYFADPSDNRVEEVAGSTGTQWGISMTAGDVYTIAGSPSGQPGTSGNGTAADKSLLTEPSAVAMDDSGDLFIADSGNNRVVEIAATSSPWGNMTGPVANDLYTVAGSATGTAGAGGDGEPATSSDLKDPTGVFIGGNAGGNLYIADAGNSRIQMVSQISQTKWGQSGMSPYDVYTVAGSSAGTAGDSGDGGAAKSAELYAPADMTVDSNGNLYIADTDNCRVQEEPKASGTQWGTIAMTANDIYTVSGRTSTGGDCTGGGNNKLATSSDLFYPSFVNTDTTGNLYIADSGSNCVKEVAAQAETQFGLSMTADYVYQVAGNGTAGSSGNGGPESSAELNYPEGVLYNSGNLYIADTNNAEVREVSGTTPYDITAVAGNGLDALTEGNGGPATTAALNGPLDAATDAAGDEFIADDGNNRIQEIAASSHTQFGITMTAGDTYTVAGNPAGALGASGDGGVATSALLDDPEAVAIDSHGDLFIADTSNNRIQEVPAASGSQFGQSMTAGDMYTIAGSASGNVGDSGNGGPAASALLDEPESMTLDAAGDVYIADSYNNRVQEVPVASSTQWGQSMTAGDMYTIAGSATGAAGDSGNGGAATSAKLSGPLGVAIDGYGNLYIADYDNNRIQEVPSATGPQRGQQLTKNDIYTIGGSSTGSSGDTGDGKTATSALLDGPTAVAASTSGDVYIADGWNSRVQEIPGSSGSQWGQSMNAGDMYTVAGNASGNSGSSGDGGPATGALMDYPNGIAIDPAGNLYVTDLNNNKIRVVMANSNPVIPVTPVGGNITVSQPGGAQVTFYPPTGGTCAAPLVAAGGYCVQAPFTGVTLTSNASNDTYTFVPSPGADSYVYSWDGQLVSESDTAGDTLTITNDYPAPGSAITGYPSQLCPAGATSCETVTSASGRALVIGSNASALVTSVTDPMGRQWTYSYDSSNQLISATDPIGNKTTYTYGAGTNGPLQVNDLLTVIGPNAQPGGPDAGDATVNIYNSANEVTSQKDPAGWTTTFNYCMYAAAGDCMNAATGTGFVSVADPDGNTTVYYYEQGTLAAQSDWTGTVGAALASEQDYTPDTTAASTANPSGGTLLPTKATDSDGGTTSYQYNKSGIATLITEPDGEGTQVAALSRTATALNEVSCESTLEAPSACSSDPGPSPVAVGQAITPPATPPSGAAETLFDAAGHELYTSTTAAAGTSTTYTLYKGNSVVLGSTNESCAATPPSASLPCATISADGVVTQLSYDSYGDLVSSSVPDGNGSQLATTTYGYDADGEQTSTTLPDGNVTGGNAANFTTTTAYDPDGEPSSVTQAGGSGATVPARTTTSSYDADGNQISAQDARGYVTTTAYNADDEPTLTTDAAGNSTLTCYDGDGNTAQTIPPAGVAAKSLTPASCPASYPAGYNPATSQLASDASMTTYDGAGNQTETYTPAPAGQSAYETASYLYDGDGNVLQTTAPPASTGGQPQVTVDTYSSTGNLVSQTAAYGTSAASTTTYCYDPNGDQTSVVYPDGNTSGVAPCETSSPWVVSASSYPAQAAYQTTSTYGAAGEQVSTTTPATAAAPNGATTSFTYDPAGNVLTTTDPDGIIMTATYTPQNQPASDSYSGSSAHSVTYGYDADGNKTSMTDGSGSSSYVYDPFGELTSATNGAGKAVSYAYDADGDASGITYPLPSSATWAGTDTISYSYDKADNLTGVTDFNGHQVAMTLNPNAAPTSTVLGLTGDTLSTTYDQTGAASAISLQSGSSTLQSFTYADAPDGDVMTETDTPSSAQSPVSYTYDSQGRMTSTTPGSGSKANFSFDASSDLTTLPTGASASYDNAGELTSSVLGGTTTNYTYSADGEQLAATQGSATMSSATWNGAEDMTAYSGAAGSMSAAAYDGTGLRTAATMTPSGGSASTQGYVWDVSPGGPDLLMDSTNAYIYAGSGAPVEQVNLATGSATYLVADSLGSVRGTLNSSGALTAATSYDAWGNPQSSGGLTASTPFGYAGGYTDPDGLIYLINRYYNPATGQFLSVDPELAETGQPYQYGDADPANTTDPTGTKGWTRRLWNYNDWHVTTEQSSSAWSICGGLDYVVEGYVCHSGKSSKLYFDTLDAVVNVTNEPHNRIRVNYGWLGYHMQQIPDHPNWVYTLCNPALVTYFTKDGKRVDYGVAFGPWPGCGWSAGVTGKKVVSGNCNNPHDCWITPETFKDDTVMTLKLWADGSQGKPVVFKRVRVLLDTASQGLTQI
jgi:RHS repeat-associated protein